MLVHLISAAVIAVGVIYHLKTVNKLKESLQEKETIIKALQLHSETEFKKQNQLQKELKGYTSTKQVSEKQSIEFPIEPVAVAKKKNSYKRKPKAKVEV